jgi:hypothetical protein
MRIESFLSLHSSISQLTNFVTFEFFPLLSFKPIVKWNYVLKLSEINKGISNIALVLRDKVLSLLESQLEDKESPICLDELDLLFQEAFSKYTC